MQTRSKARAQASHAQKEDPSKLVPIAPAVLADGAINKGNSRPLVHNSDEQFASADLKPNNDAARTSTGRLIPVYTIDLSLLPCQRYVDVAIDFKDQINDITSLFDEVVSTSILPIWLAKWLSKVALRRLYSKEQTEELNGIQKAIGIQMYLLIAFNTLLDLFMGCTSGGAKVQDSSGTRMLHFRTLDWGMDVLRDIIIQLDFVKKAGGPVVARSITYAGFVGILTGVRQDLSVSLNFRPYHNNDSSFLASLRFYSSHLIMLLGLRPSICSHLRDLILPRQLSQSETDKPAPPRVLKDIVESFPSLPSTAAYVILCDGTTTSILEKDLRTAVVHTSTSFIVATNHDTHSEASTSKSKSANRAHHNFMHDLLTESMDRKACIRKRWDKAVKQYKKRNPGAQEDETTVRPADVIRWVQGYPTTNESTHFACVMDPTKAEMVWVRKEMLEDHARDMTGG